jgi:hypothetical protein
VNSKLHRDKASGFRTISGKVYPFFVEAADLSGDYSSCIRRFGKRIGIYAGMKTKFLDCGKNTVNCHPER